MGTRKSGDTVLDLEVEETGSLFLPVLWKAPGKDLYWPSQVPVPSAGTSPDKQGQVLGQAWHMLWPGGQAPFISAPVPSPTAMWSVKERRLEKEEGERKLGDVARTRWKGMLFTGKQLPVTMFHFSFSTALFFPNF